MADSGAAVEAAAPPENLNGVDDSALDPSPAIADDENPSTKRKLDDLEPRDDEEAPLKKQEIEPSENAADDTAVDAGEAGEEAPADAEIDGAEEEKLKENEAAAEPESENAAAEETRDGVEADEAGIDSAKEAEKDAPSTENGQDPSVQDSHNLSGTAEESSRRIDVPNSKVGVLIGKAGDTIKFLQLNSGAKIQITRDAEADPEATTRPVELLGTPEQINKAERLIKDVIAEAEAGGSPSLVARGFGTAQSGGDQVEIKVPNDKVGLVIGKGGETIKNLQTRSGARIQLIPQHLPEGDSSKERIVRITGNKKQIDTAREMIKEAMNQMHRPSSHSGGYNQQGFRPRGPASGPQWGPRPSGHGQPSGYDYQQRGSYPPPQTSQYHQSYGGYPQQPPPRGGFGSGWDQRSGAPIQGGPPSGGYDYYGQGGHANQHPPTNQMPNPAHPSAPVNYNYGQSQPPNYGHPTPYGQQTQHGYGPGYNDNQTPNQNYYGQQPMGAQPGPYGQHASAPQSGYGQQQSYNKAGYGVPQEAPPNYGPPRAAHPGDPMYQGSAPPSYPAQHQYPYGSTPSQPAPAYNQTYPASGAMDGYTQQPATYPQHGGQAAPAYAQGQPAPAYTQPSAQPGAYGQYPTQPGYTDPAAANATYPYHGAPTDAGYGGAAPSAGYGAAPQATAQPGYAQPAANPAGYYDQSVPPQAGYAGQQQPAAPVGYTKSVSPQPAAYAGQYDNTQMYGHH